MKLKSLVIFSILVLPLVFGVFLSCTKEKAPLPPPCGLTADSTISFSAHVFPIIQQNCAINSDCHGAGAAFQPHYDGYAAVKSVVDAGSFEYHLFGDGQMPPSYAPDSAQLSSCEKDFLRWWYDQGAQNN